MPLSCNVTIIMCESDSIMRGGYCLFAKKKEAWVKAGFTLFAKYFML
jgi:hypothetical protein